MHGKTPETTMPDVLDRDRRLNCHEPLEIGTKTKLLIAAGALLTAAAIGNLWHRLSGEQDG